MGPQEEFLNWINALRKTKKTEQINSSFVELQISLNKWVLNKEVGKWGYVERGLQNGKEQKEKRLLVPILGTLLINYMQTRCWKLVSILAACDLSVQRISQH